VGTPVDSSRVARLAAGMGTATGSALANGDERPASLTPWLLAIALACALLELLVRGRSEPEAA
jgi:hypothetical protein